MRRRNDDLQSLFLVGLSLAAASCAAAAADAGGTPVASASADGTGSADPIEKPAASARPVAGEPAPDPSTPEGYARGYRSAGPFAAALSGLELQGFAEFDGDRLVCEDEKPCPASWDSLETTAYGRVAVVKKRYSLAAITTTNFFEWVGPVQDPERAALRAKLEDRRDTTTCGKLAELGYPCATGSDPAGIPVRVVRDGFEVATFDSRNVCEGSKWGNAVSLGALVIDREGEARDADNVLIEATDAKARENVTCRYPMKGRSPRGYVATAPAAGESSLSYLLRAAREEAAAAIAFEELADELAHHGAPEDLTRDARRSAADERRHAALFRREAARRMPGFVGDSEAPRRAPARARSLASMLVENAREGCANETYAAVVATHQAMHATTARERALFRGVARDEQRHAELAHRIHAWGRTVVDGAARARVDAAFEAAVSGFALGGATTPAGLALGEPAPELARAAFMRVVRALEERVARA